MPFLPPNQQGQSTAWQNSQQSPRWRHAGNVWISQHGNVCHLGFYWLMESGDLRRLTVPHFLRMGQSYLSSSRIQMDALGHTLTPFCSVCRQFLGFIPGDVHVLQTSSGSIYCKHTAIFHPFLQWCRTPS